MTGDGAGVAVASAAAGAALLGPQPAPERSSVSAETRRVNEQLEVDMRDIERLISGEFEAAQHSDHTLCLAAGRGYRLYRDAFGDAFTDGNADEHLHAERDLALGEVVRLADFAAQVPALHAGVKE